MSTDQKFAPSAEELFGVTKDEHAKPGQPNITLAARINNPDQQAEQLVAVLEINDKHALVSEQGKVVIVTERFDERLNRIVLDRSTAADFRLFYKNRSVIDGKRRVPLGDFWIEHPQRRQYDEILFDPSPGREPKQNVYNLWRGWGVTPRPEDLSGGYSCRIFKEHLLQIGCAGDIETYEYMLDWFAWMFQHPERPAGTCIVLRGNQGAGKGAIMRAIGKICGQHFVHISSVKHLVGNFNGHLHDAIFVFSDEAFWAGDIQNTGALKTLITEPTVMIERKHRDVFSVPNRVHLMMATNNDWAAPVSLDDRRFCVIDVPDARVGDDRYFANLNFEIDNGGMQVFLHEMLNRKVKGEPRTPATAKQSEAMMAQKFHGMLPIPKWWYERLESGAITRKLGSWQSEITKQELYDDYLAQMDELNISRRASSSDLARTLREFTGLATSRKTTPHGRIYMWTVPDLQKCREAFAAFTRMPHLFPPDVEDLQL